MEQPYSPHPPSESKPSPPHTISGGKVFFGSLLLYFFSYYLPDIILFSTSFEDWKDLGFSLQNAGASFIQSLPMALLSLACPLVIAVPLIEIAPPSRRSRLIAASCPLLCLTGLILYSQIAHPQTSKARFQKSTRTPVPPDARHYRSCHPFGANIFSHAFTGTRDYYSFQLNPESHQVFLNTLTLSEDFYKDRLTQSDRILGEVPPDFKPNLLHPDIQVYRISHSGFVVTRPGTQDILVIWWQIPH
jgi:hypothetical protein